MKVNVKKRILSNMQMDVSLFRKVLSETLDLSKAVYASVKIISSEDSKLPREAILNALIDRQNWGIFLRDLQGFTKKTASLTFVACNVCDYITYTPLYEMKSSNLFVFSEEVKGDDLSWSEELFLIDDVCRDVNDFFRSLLAKIGYADREGGFVDSEKEVKNNVDKDKTCSQEGATEDSCDEEGKPVYTAKRSDDLSGLRGKGLGSPKK